MPQAHEWDRCLQVERFYPGYAPFPRSSSSQLLAFVEMLTRRRAESQADLAFDIPLRWEYIAVASQLVVLKVAKEPRVALFCVVQWVLARACTA